MRASLYWLLLLILLTSSVQAQSFDFAGKDAVKVPEASLKQIRQYVETHDGTSMAPIGSQYPYVPVFNVLNRKEKQFTEGLYYFTTGSHDSGRLFIYRKGRITFLANGSIASILSNYTSYLKQYPLPESTQVAYLSAIAAFMKFRYADRQMLIKSGAIEVYKD
ncbi:hypothetical protein GCM10027346_42620 [Hymenobacter seoulensis]